MKKKPQPPGDNEPYLFEEMRPKPAAKFPYVPPWKRGNDYKGRSKGRTAWGVLIREEKKDGK